MSFFRKYGVVNVKMVITEEKILSNIEKVQRLINPASKKQIVELEEDSYFKDLIDSIKTYLIEYPKKKNFPVGVYKASYDLVEFATNQFEENTKKVEELIKQREENISLASDLKYLFELVDQKDENWVTEVENSREKFSEDVIDTLSIIGRSRSQESVNYSDAVKLIKAKVNNLEKNLHIEIEMERIEDRSKALSYIGIEIAEALKQIPIPVNYSEYVKEQKAKEQIQQTQNQQMQEMDARRLKQGRRFENEGNTNIQQTRVRNKSGKYATESYVMKNNQKSQMIDKNENFDLAYQEQVTFETKPTFWERVKNTKVMKAINSLFRLKIVIQTDALPEGNNTNKY